MHSWGYSDLLTPKNKSVWVREQDTVMLCINLAPKSQLSSCRQFIYFIQSNPEAVRTGAVGLSVLPTPLGNWPISVP